MSASTRTIQRPMGQGSILGAIAIGVVTLLVVGALAWFVNATATKQSATQVAPVAAPIYVDRDGRDALPAPKAAQPTIVPFDMDKAHAAPYVDRFAPIQPETVFDRAHAAPYQPADK